MNKTIWMGVALGVALSGMATAAQATVAGPTVDPLGVLAYSPAITAYGTYTLDIYRAGSNAEGSAMANRDFYDPASDYAGGNPVIQWSFSIGSNFVNNAKLSIFAEGIDPNENDEVLMNNTSLGYLTKQASASTGSTLGYHEAIAAGNGRTESIFNLGTLSQGLYTFTILLPAGVPDTGGGGVAYVNEIEKSILTLSDPTPPSSVPIPSTGLLLGTALVGCTALVRKRRF